MGKKNNIQKSGSQTSAETGVFLAFWEKWVWQNCQFYRNSVDKKGKIDYIVKSKTNRVRHISYSQCGNGSVCYKILLSTYQIFKFLGGRYR